jgi:hypothetical protein
MHRWPRGILFGPKTLLFFALQVPDSTHYIFVRLDAQNHMIPGSETDVW